MEESKRKMIEARLQELISQSKRQKSAPLEPKITVRPSVRVIRRRKGQPDLKPA